MKDLRDFVIPNSNSPCLCEIDGRTHYADQNYSNVNAYTLAIETHPNIHVTSELLHPVSSGDEGRALFLPVDVPFLKQLTQVYYEQGVVEALHMAASHNHLAIAKSATMVLSILQYIHKVRLFLNPKGNYKGIQTIDEYSQTRNWYQNTIRCISWHPYSCKIAVCTSDDSVRIYTNETSASFLLRCKQQKNITCLAWRPLTNSEIAVGHEGGIIVWSIDPHSLVFRPSVSNATILYKLEHTPVVGITWGTRGEVLVSAAACDSTIYVWDVELNKTSSLKRPGGSGNVLVKWSPTGDKMFSASTGIVFRVWDCREWQCERWTVLSGRVQSACWTSCGSHILFTTSTEPIIYSLRVKNDLVFTSDTESSQNEATAVFDLTKLEIDGVCVGGLIQTMEIDPKGTCLAVLFQTTNAIGLFDIAKKQPLELIASSLVTGHPEEIPVCISFQQNFTSGSCLSIGWSSGRVQHFPIIYSDLTDNYSATHLNKKVL